MDLLPSQDLSLPNGESGKKEEEMIVVSTVTTVHFTNLQAGEKLELSATFHYGEHGAHAIEYGQNDGSAVLEDGTISFSFSTHTLTRGHQGTGRFWLRPAGSPQDADPINDLSGHPALVVGQHLP